MPLKLPATPSATNAKLCFLNDPATPQSKKNSKMAVAHNVVHNFGAIFYNEAILLFSPTGFINIFNFTRRQRHDTTHRSSVTTYPLLLSYTGKCILRSLR
jgi:hypothetical protein